MSHGDPTLSFRTLEAGPEHAKALSAMFARAEVPCHCRYWHFAGGTNAWLDRMAHTADRNRAEMEAALLSNSPEMTGIVAMDGEEAIGWLKVSPASALPKLYDQRLYRSLPCFSGTRDGVRTVGCVLVDPLRRRQGVARAMLRHAVDSARARGATAIEAFPRRAEGVSDAELWTGPFGIFSDAGFDVVHDFAPYPVLRLTL